jgi:hypothetical protein
MSDLLNIGQNVILSSDVSYSNTEGYASINNPFTGRVYAFYGSGGFTIDQCFNTVKLIPESQIFQYDVTNSVQVRLDVRTFNEKLGLFKDSKNQYILYSSYDTIRDVFTSATQNNEQNPATSSMLDTITLSADEFVNGLVTSYVMSVGSYNTMYMDFTNYVNTYFGYAGGFGTLFSGASEFNLNNGVFDASAFVNIINAYYTPSGEQVKPLTGTVTLTNVNSLLKYAINTNCFNNRSPVTDLSASDPGDTEASRYPSLPSSYPTNVQVTNASSFRADWGMADGFVAGDLIFVPAGTRVQLHLVLDTELFTPINNIGPANVGFNEDGSIRVGSLTYATNQQTALVTTNPYYTVALGQFTTDTSATRFNIDRNLTAPLLIKLDNLSTLTDAPSGTGGFKNDFSTALGTFRSANYDDVNNPTFSTLEGAQASAALRNSNALNNWNNSQTNFGPSS